MTWLENHHAMITLFTLCMVLGVAAVGIYFARSSPTGIAAIVGPAVAALTGIHVGTSAVAANPGTTAYGSTPPAIISSSTPPPGQATPAAAPRL